MNIDDRRPTTDLRVHSHILQKKSNGHNSATRQPIRFVFGYRVGFKGTADRSSSNGAISGRINFKMAAGGHFENFKRP